MLVHVFIVRAVAVVEGVGEETCAVAAGAAGSGETGAQSLGAGDHGLSEDFLSLELYLVVLETADVLFYVGEVLRSVFD